MKNVEETYNGIFKSGILLLRYFDCANPLFGNLLSQYVENQQTTPRKYTLLIPRVRQNEHKKAFGKSPPYKE